MRSEREREEEQWGDNSGEASEMNVEEDGGTDNERAKYSKVM